MQEEGWTNVSFPKSYCFRWDVFPFGGRNRNSALSIVTSVYVSEFPEKYTAKNLFELFGCSGNVVEVAISPRRNKFGKRFGFARFTDVEDGRMLAIRLDNIIIAGRKIHVNLPRFGRAQIGEVGRKGILDRVPVIRAYFKGNLCSYAEAIGKEVEGYMKKEEKKFLLKFQSSSALRSRFEKAYVGKVCIPGSAYNVKNHLEMEGVFAIKVTPLGCNYCLLEEKEDGFIYELIKDGESWWKSWFSEIEKWELGKVDNIRDVWIRIYGTPVHVWCSDFFVALGEEWGRFICIDENTAKGETFDVARILVNIPISFIIPDCVTVIIDGKSCNLFIREDSQSFYRSVEGKQKVFSSDGASTDSEFGWNVVNYELVGSGGSEGSEAGTDLPSEPRGKKDEIYLGAEGRTPKFCSSDRDLHASSSSSANHRYSHSDDVPEFGSCFRADGYSVSVPDGGNILIGHSGAKNASDDVTVGGLVICKGSEGSEASSDQHLVPRGKKDVVYIGEKGRIPTFCISERGLGEDPSVSFSHSCSDGSPECVPYFRADGNSGLGPDDCKVHIGNSGAKTGSDVATKGTEASSDHLQFSRGKKAVCASPSAKLSQPRSAGVPDSVPCIREVGSSGLGPDECKVLNGHYGVKIGSVVATEGTEASSEHLLCYRGKKVVCASSSVKFF